MYYRYLLFVRFILFNVVGFALLAAVYLQGWLKGVFYDTTFELSLIIAAVFLYGLALCGAKVWKTSVELNALNAQGPDNVAHVERYTAALHTAETGSAALAALRMTMSNRIAIVRHVANLLVFLGLIGTVIGFIIALSGVNPATATDADNVAKMVATLVVGMSVALYTTLVGAILHVWLVVNHRMLVSGTVRLISAIAARGETYGRT